MIFPDRVAWIATEVVLFSGHRRRHVRLPAGPDALHRGVRCWRAVTFTFSGTVFSQVNHLDMTEGFVAIPWMLLAVLHIVREGGGAGPSCSASVSPW